MIIDHDTEKCRACTVKHLSAALVALEGTELLDRADFAGNLGHAANHFMWYSADIAAQIRQLRLDAQDEKLNYALSAEDIRTRLGELLKAVTDFEEPVEAPVAVPVVQAAPKASGCGCRRK